MNNLKIISLTASMVLAMVFTFSCSDDEGGGESSSSVGSQEDGSSSSVESGQGSSSSSSSSIVGGQGSSSSSSVGGQGGSSSSSEVSSSSVEEISSSSVGGQSSDSSSSVGGGNACSADFRTVKIGTQTWMAENLNCNVEGSRCYDDDPANCAKYGRLYDWATAMNFPSDSDCNSRRCETQIQSKHKGICPSGWHIPSYKEWGTLSNYVESNSDCIGCDAVKLKAASDWNDYNEVSGNGTDDYEFSALPGGKGGWDYFDYVGYSGYWWSATEGWDVSDNNSSTYAYGRYIYYGSELAYWIRTSRKSGLYSVRCLQD